MVQKDAQEALKKRTTQFIETRSVIQQSIDNYLKKLKSVDPELLKGIKPLRGSCAKEVVSALWEEPFNQDLYQQQLSEFNEFVNAVDAVAQQLADEAMKLLK